MNVERIVIGPTDKVAIFVPQLTEASQREIVINRMAKFLEIDRERVCLLGEGITLGVIEQPPMVRVETQPMTPEKIAEAMAIIEKSKSEPVILQEGDRYCVAFPRSEYHEDDGCVVWWRTMPPCEPPVYVGAEIDSDFPEDGHNCNWWSRLNVPTSWYETTDGGQRRRVFAKE